MKHISDVESVKTNEHITGNRMAAESTMSEGQHCLALWNKPTEQIFIHTTIRAMSLPTILLTVSSSHANAVNANKVNSIQWIIQN
jgi:hypothetical protein